MKKIINNKDKMLIHEMGGLMAKWLYIIGDAHKDDKTMLINAKKHTKYAK